ncbi:MAG: QueT transporter family protein [Actinobacteria bacterium]|nr:MAG: QueT transporter family protein [Actinomycetota bacterium]
MRSTRFVAQAGVIAALYAGLTLFALTTLSVLAWGPVQFRVSEALTVVACLTPAAVPGLWIGSVLANLWNLSNPMGWMDVVFGSLGSLLGAAWSWRFRRTVPLALAGPVLFNALIVPAYLPAMLAAAGIPPESALPLPGVLRGTWLDFYLWGVLTVGLGQVAVVYGIGWPLLAAVKRTPLAAMLGVAGAER